MALIKEYRASSSRNKYVFSIFSWLTNHRKSEEKDQTELESSSVGKDAKLAFLNSVNR